MYLNINKDTSVASSYSVNLKNFYFKERNVYQKSIRRRVLDTFEFKQLLLARTSRRTLVRVNFTRDDIKSDIKFSDAYRVFPLGVTRMARSNSALKRANEFLLISKTRREEARRVSLMRFGNCRFHMLASRLHFVVTH